MLYSDQKQNLARAPACFKICTQTDKVNLWGERRCSVVTVRLQDRMRIFHGGHECDLAAVIWALEGCCVCVDKTGGARRGRA